ncbi:iron complex outermembrane receptor protein [Luteibacter jiangsuensis]|uniref:Iron complex outermembrane receptor protein n=1 Tax=Luteibacter jiangsuensis TaxID=637577 RepID=A0ABT9SVZ4_9GAMM|nr:TonB-dependent receptor [Luteibacter jiangsuensis]MDQ0009166.1 iron complex outermembrane receptor protein [Luteibacter jiangsuensis]
MPLLPDHGRALARAIACAIGASSLAAHATGGDDDPQRATTLREVRVSAASHASDIDPDMPSAVETVSAAQLDRLNIVNSEDALKYLPSFGIRKRFIGDENATFSVRGTSNQQSARGLVYLDGLLLSNLLGNNWANPPRWSMAFPENLARVEVIYGAYSALYPGNAIGATVLMTTRMPEKLEISGHVQAFTQHVDSYGVDRDYGGSRQSVTIGDRSGRFAFLIGVAHLQSNGQPLVYATQNRSTRRGTSNPVTGAVADTGANGLPREVLGINSEGQEATRQDEAHIRLTYDFTPDLTGAFTAGYWKQDLSHRTETFLRDGEGKPVWAGPVTIDGRQYTIPTNFFAPSTRQSRNTLYGMSLGTHRTSGWNIESDASMFDMGRNRDRVAAGVTENGAGLLTAGDGSRWRTFDLRASHTPDTLSPNTHTVSFGYHFDGYRLDNASYTLAGWRNGARGPRTAANGGSTQTQAAYLQDAWQLDERWRLTVGARYEQWRAFGGSRATGTTSIGYPERDESHTSPKASLAWSATDSMVVRLSGARAYRFPTVNELFQGTFNGISLVNNDPHLRPENDLSRELSVEWYRANSLTRFTLYRSDTRDTLFSQTDTTVFPNVTSVQNVDRVRTRGAEASYDGQDVFWHGFDLTANAAYTQATTLRNTRNPASEGKQFYRIPRWRANVVATWRATERLSLVLAGRYSGRQYNTLDHSDVNPDTFGGASDFLVFDAKVDWKVSPRVSLGIGIDNLTDRRYYVYYPYPSRTCLMEATFHL